MRSCGREDLVCEIVRLLFCPGMSAFECITASGTLPGSVVCETVARPALHGRRNDGGRDHRVSRHARLRDLDKLAIVLFDMYMVDARLVLADFLRAYSAALRYLSPPL